MRQLLQILSLSDRYERKTLLLPGLIAASSVSLTAGAFTAGQGNWFKAIGAVAGMEVLFAFLLGYLARACGKSKAEKFWQDMGSVPTTRWLQPTDTTCSAQQKKIWRGVIKRLTDLSIPASTSNKDSAAEAVRVIADATRQLRNDLRGRPEASMLQIHLEDYGLARNLLGLRWYWLGLSGLVFVVTCVAALFGTVSVPAFVVSGLSILAALFVGQQLPNYLRHCADRYANSFFAAIVAYDAVKNPSAVKSACV